MICLVQWSVGVERVGFDGNHTRIILNWWIPLPGVIHGDKECYASYFLVGTDCLLRETKLYTAVNMTS